MILTFKDPPTQKLKNCILLVMHKGRFFLIHNHDLNFWIFGQFPEKLPVKNFPKNFLLHHLIRIETFCLFSPYRLPGPKNPCLLKNRQKSTQLLDSWFFAVTICKFFILQLWCGPFCTENEHWVRSLAIIRA